MQINGFDILPGDCLLYATADLVDWAIEAHTGGIAAHVEVYVGTLNGAETSLASRNGVGVGSYPARTTGCVAILRPASPFSVKLGLMWFETVNHEGYDWQGLLNFFKPGDTVTAHALFCSAFEVEFYRACGFDVVHPQFPSNKFSPSDNFKAPGFTWIYHAPL